MFENGNHRQIGVSSSSTSNGRSLFESMMRANAQAFEIDPNTLQPTAERLERVAAAAAYAVEQTEASAPVADTEIALGNPAPLTVELPEEI